MNLYIFPEKLSGCPCVKCPPCARFIPSTVSPNCSAAIYTETLACVPECDCTLACSAPNSGLGAIDSQLLDSIGKFAAAVLALTGIAFRVFVGQHGTQAASRTASDTKFLRRDQLKAGTLAPSFVAESVRNFRDQLRPEACSGVMRNCGFCSHDLAIPGIILSDSIGIGTGIPTWSIVSHFRGCRYQGLGSASPIGIAPFLVFFKEGLSF